MSLSLEFNSIAEMQDWIVKEAEQIASNNVTVAIKAVDRKITAQDVKDVPTAAEPKLKRKRRTKAEMAAARAAERQAIGATEPDQAAEALPAKVEAEAAPEPPAKVEAEAAPEPPAEVEAAATPAGGNGAGDLQKRFMALMARDPHAAVAELDRVVGPSGKFSQCAVEVQREILAVLEARQ